MYYYPCFMSKQAFAFKKFTVRQDRSAHKVGTDAVILGSWAYTDDAHTILDIGTGTGIIALMMAQKSNAVIDAVDIEESSYGEAKENFTRSPWSERLHAFHASFQNFAAASHKKYDLVITNPPYFVDSYKAPDEERNNARHNDVLPFTDLIDGVKKILSLQGYFYIILPTKEALDFTLLATKNGLFLNRLLKVKTKSTSDTDKRRVMLFTFNNSGYKEETISIEHDDHHEYTAEYKAMTKQFYLHF